VAVNTQTLSECMARFKNHDPPLYEKFIRALDAYVSEVTLAVLDAPPETVMQAQGRAQTAHKFYRLFTELVRGPNAPSP
jgi:hypothetical protein